MASYKSIEKLEVLVEMGCSTSTNINRDPQAIQNEKGRKKVYWMDEEVENENKKGDEQESFRMLGKDDIYSCGETMGWVAERIGSPKRRVVASEDPWWWRKK